jgi:hypothetical protein
MEKTKDRTPEDNTAYATKQYWDQRYEQCVSFHSIHNIFLREFQMIIARFDIYDLFNLIILFYLICTFCQDLHLCR